MNEFGQKIKKIRKDRGLTQQEFADSLGYAHKSTINKIESGHEDMSYQKILILLKEYALEAKDLFDDPENEIAKIDKLIDESKKNRHDSCVVYIHGLYGNSKEADYLQLYSNKYDIIGLDYNDGNPWEVKNKIIEDFYEISKKYKSIYVVANSIGAFYTYMFLSNYNIKKAFFISPLVDMKKTIEKLMDKNNISMETLINKKTIILKNGHTLSFDFLESLKQSPSWNVKTHILYGEKDKVVDHNSIFEFVSNYDCSLTIMKNAGHYFHTPGQLKFVKKWINEYLSEK